MHSKMEIVKFRHSGVKQSNITETSLLSHCEKFLKWNFNTHNFTHLINDTKTEIN